MIRFFLFLSQLHEVCELAILHNNTLTKFGYMLDKKNYNIFEISLCRQLTRAYNLNMAISTFFSSKCGEFGGFFTKIPF